MQIGPWVKSAFHGYLEFTGQPAAIVLNRCPIRPAAICRLEYHDAPITNALTDKKSQQTSVADVTLQYKVPLTQTYSLEVGRGIRMDSVANAGLDTYDRGPAPVSTLLRSIEVSSMAQGISYEPQANVFTDSRKLLIVFSGCSQPDQWTVKSFQLNCDDQLRLMNFPVLRTYTPKVSQPAILLARKQATVAICMLERRGVFWHIKQ